MGILAFLLRTSHAMVALAEPKQIGRGPDAWIAALLGTLAGVGVIGLVAGAAARRPDRSIIERFRSALGPFLGRLAGGALCGLFLLNAMLTARLYGGLLVAQPMPETPVEAFVVLLTAGAWYAAWHGPEVTARVSETVLPVILAGVGFVFLLGARDMDPRELKPLLGWGWWLPVRAALTTFALHFELLPLAMLVPQAAEPRRAARAAVLGVAAAGALVALSTAGVVMFYGSAEARRITFPLYDLARSVSVGDVVERMDPLFILTWTMGGFIKVAVLLWATALGVVQLLGLREYRPLVGPVALLCIFGSVLLYDSQAELITFQSPQVLPWAMWPFLVGLPPLLGLAEWLRSHRGMGS